VLALSACGGGNSSSSSSSSETSNLRVALTDAPVDDATAVCVTITGIELNFDDSGWEVYPFDATTLPDSMLCDPDDPGDDNDTFSDHVNLLSLTEGASIELLDEEVATGTYKVRLVLAEDDGEGQFEHYIVPIDTGSPEDLFIPSGSETGLKLSSSIVVAANSPASYTIDFDVRKSVVLRGNPSNNNGYLLKPVLRLVNNVEAGNISGIVYEEGGAPTEISATDLVVDLTTETNCTDTDPLTDNVVYIFEGNIVTDLAGNTSGDLGSAAQPITTTVVGFEESVYSYTSALLVEGDYTVAFTCRAGEDDPDTADEDLDFQDIKLVTVTADFSDEDKEDEED